ncbi:MAG: transposase [Myxococcota bacterium]
MDTLQKFLRELERLPKGSRRRYSNRLKALAISHVDSVIGRGGTQAQAARELGVNPNSLRQWRTELRTTTHVSVQPVTVVSDESYMVFGPGGLRVECRSAEAVARLFSALS